MRAVGIDIAERRPKKLMREMQLHADWAVTMGCGDACPYVPTSVEDWDVPDPAGCAIEEVRAICEDIERRVRELIATGLDAIRSDRTAHQLRLEKLLPQLAREFEGQRSPGEIRACADAVHRRSHGDTDRSYVQTLAYRRTRHCLRAERCEALLAR